MVASSLSLKGNEHLPLAMAFAAGCLTAAALLLASDRFFVKPLKAASSLPSSSNNYSPAEQAPPPLSPELRAEQLSRNSLFFGTAGMSRIMSSTVIVVGLGGVGSHCAHMLARSGVQRLILVDFDQVTLSSTNRHATATLKDVGTSKVMSVQRYLKQVCPNCEVVSLNTMFNDKTASSILDVPPGSPPISYVVDAIDDLPTKALLIKSCLDRDLKIISSMGAACKSDPTRLHIGDLKCATRDPLCSKLRWHLKRMSAGPEKSDATTEKGREKDNNDAIEKYVESTNFHIMYSSEKVTAVLAPLTPEQEANPGLYGNVDFMRIRVLPVVGTMPAIMGQAIASFVLCNLGDKPFSPVSVERMGKSLRHTLLQHIKGRELELKKIIEKGEAPPGAVHGVEVDIDDVEYLMAELWSNRCAITEVRLGNQLELIKWDVTKVASMENLVLMSAHGKAIFVTAGGKDGLPTHIIQRVEKRLAVVRALHCS